MSTEPTEVSKEEAENNPKLDDLLAEKAKAKLALIKNNSFNLLKRSKFYYVNGGIREHIATYKGYAILLNPEKLKTELNDKEDTVYPSLLKTNALKKLKKVNGNVVRKLNPNTLPEFYKMNLLLGTLTQIDNMVI